MSEQRHTVIAPGMQNASILAFQENDSKALQSIRDCSVSRSDLPTSKM
jgi:hypothetical protein